MDKGAVSLTKNLASGGGSGSWNSLGKEFVERRTRDVFVGFRVQS